MSKNSLELKDFVNDPTFIENMNRAFSDLRADYELSMDSTCEKINELKSLHVDVKNHLSDLTSWSRKNIQRTGFYKPGSQGGCIFRRSRSWCTDTGAQTEKRKRPKRPKFLFS